MKLLRIPARFLTAAMFAALPMLLGGLVVGTAAMARASFWMFSEVLISTLLSTALGFVALLAIQPGVLLHLDRLVARSFELVAAVPVVVATAIVATQLPWPISLSVAIVVGLLDGLKCIREVASRIPDRAATSTRGTARSLLLTTMRGSLAIVLPTVIERIVTLEAALSWLELFPTFASGGWGDQLGQAARRGELVPLLSWTFAAAGSSCTLKLLASRAHPTHQGSPDAPAP